MRMLWPLKWENTLPKQPLNRCSSNLCMAAITKSHLTLSWRRPLSYRNQSIDLLRKSMDWFLYGNDLRHERVKNVNEAVKFSKCFKRTPFYVHFKDFHLSCKTVLLHNSFSLKHLLMAIGNSWNYCGKSLPDLCLLTEVRHRISKKSVVKTFLNILLTVKPKWPNVWASKTFFHISKFYFYILR